MTGLLGRSPTSRELGLDSPDRVKCVVDRVGGLND